MKTNRAQVLSPLKGTKESKMNLDQYRSPSMWEKLEEWKAQKQQRQGDKTKKAPQPFKAGSSKAVARIVPSKASEKMRLLSESNRRITWTYRNSPRHLNYRKSMGTVTKVDQAPKKGVLSENRKSVGTGIRGGQTLKRGVLIEDRRSMGTGTNGGRVSKNGGLRENRTSMDTSTRGGRAPKNGELNNGKENLRQSTTKLKKSTMRTAQATGKPAERGSGRIQKQESDSSKRGSQENSMRPTTKAKMNLPNQMRKETARNTISRQQDCKKRKIPSREQEDEDENELRSALKVQRTAAVEAPVACRSSMKASSSSDRFRRKQVTEQARGGYQVSSGAGKRLGVKLPDGGRKKRKDTVQWGEEVKPEMEAVTPGASQQRRSIVGSATQRDMEQVGGSSPLSGSENFMDYEAAQMKRRQELEQWLLAKGRTPRRAANFLKTPRVVSRSARKRTLEGGSDPYSIQLTVEEAMDACRNLLDEGCPAAYLSGWLEGLEEKLPCLTGMESFVECQAVVQRELQAQPADMTDGAGEHPLPSPADDAAPVSTPRRKARRSSYQLLSPVREESSAVKYQVKEATPYFKRIQEALGNPSNTPSTMIVTPVRRSIRLSKRKSVTFASRQLEADVCVDSLNELEEKLEQPVQLILRSNRALEDEFELTEEGIQEALGNPSNTPSTMIVTPVRRSIRLSKRKSVTFASRQLEADVCVDSLNELEEKLEQPVQLILRSNRALEDEFELTEEG